MKTIHSSPHFPRSYPDNMNCITFVIAPNGFRILIEFEELVIEQEPQCSYDFVEIFEPVLDQTITKNLSNERLQNMNLFLNKENGLNEHLESEYRLLMNYYSLQRPQRKFIFHPSNTTYNILKPPPSLQKEEFMPRRICGDWSSKLKLLRHQTNKNMMSVRFSSDYSHHFNGFKAKISLEKGWYNNLLEFAFKGNCNVSDSPF